MADNDIVIDGMIFPNEVGNPTIYFRPNESEQLAKIMLNLRTTSPDESEQIEELVRRPWVTVKDPFTNREYKATVEKTIEHPTGGENWERRYSLDVFEDP